MNKFQYNHSPEGFSLVNPSISEAKRNLLGSRNHSNTSLESLSLPNIVFILFIFFVISCGRKNSDSSFTEILYQPKVSKSFEISQDTESGEVKISVKNPWEGATNISKELTLHKIPERIVCLSTTHIAMIDALGETGKIVGISGKPYINNAYIQKNQDKIPDIGYEGNIDYETLVSLNPDMVLMFSVNGASSMEKRLEELGIPYIYIGDYREDDPLGKAEWIIPIAQILGKRERGEELFKQISDRYNGLKKKVETTNLPKPKVILNGPYADSWFMPSSDSYIAKMMKDAGAEYLYKKNTGNSTAPIDLEEAYKMASEADFWINPNTFQTKEELISALPKFKDTHVVVSGNVYNNNKITSEGGGNDCYESGVVNPDLILRDLIKIFHPELIEEDFTYYHRLE